MKSSVLFLLIIIGILSCKDDDHGSGSALEGCCGNEAIDEEVGNGHIYVPNIFTPNGDGLNDYLYVGTDSVDLLVEVEIRDKSGVIVFETFDAEINDPGDQWNGRIDGVVVEGLYTITVSVLAKDGTSHTVEGKVCNFPCNGDNVTVRVTGESCQFPTQSYNGHFDPTIPSGEGLDCYE